MKFVRREAHLGYIDTHLWVPKDAINVAGVKSALTFLITSERGESRYLQLYEETHSHLIVPRAFWNVAEMDFETVDCRPVSFEPVLISSSIQLDKKNPSSTTQRQAVEAILNSTGGILQLACGKGKTVCALHVASILAIPTLIVVNNNNLLKQWLGEIERHLYIPEGVGLIQGDVCDWKKPIVLSTYQTLANRADSFPEEVRRWFGLGIFDEAHHSAAPWFSKTIDLLYGMRLLLTATPERNDGSHVVYNFHVGNVVYKDLKQDLTPYFHFLWTGLSLDLTNDDTKRAVHDCNGELHLSKLAGHFGKWRERLEFILKRVRKHEAEGRKTLVLSNSVGELVNLLALYNGMDELYTELEETTAEDLGEEIVPLKLHPKGRKRYELERLRLSTALFDKTLNSFKKEEIKKTIALIDVKLERDAVARKIGRLHLKDQKGYVKKLIAMPSTAGLMVAKVPLKERTRMLREKKTTFAIYAYGLEGLDDANLDTIIAAEPMTSKNALQQFIGRTLRLSEKIGKKPLVEFLEDDIGPIIGMCKSVRIQLRQWPVDEGGPYEYELIDNPHNKRIPWKPNPQQQLNRFRIGQSLSPPLASGSGAS